MLTWHDYTVENAEEIFEQCKLSKAKYWGFKEHPLPLDRMKALFHHMKQCGKTTVLEVVAYTEQEGLEGARIAATCGCDILMGTKFHDSINSYCLEHGIKYMPFVGDVTGRPSVLEGTIDGIIAQAQDYIAKGAYGIDLLGYRFIRLHFKHLHGTVIASGTWLSCLLDVEGVEICHETLNAFAVVVAQQQRFPSHCMEAVEQVINGGCRVVAMRHQRVVNVEDKRLEPHFHELLIVDGEHVLNVVIGIENS